MPHKVPSHTSRTRTILRRRWLTLLAAVVLALAGIAGSLLGARAVSDSAAHARRLSFQVSAREIASTLGLAIQREEDLVVAASAYVVSHPVVSPAGFDQWVQAVRALERHPELLNIGLVQLVPAQRLKQFESAIRAHPVEPLGLHTAKLAPRFELLPPGRRPFYCFAVAGIARSLQSYIPSGLDYCTVAGALVSSRETGLASYAPLALGSRRELAVQTPVYREAMVPAGVAERRRQFVGWLGELIAPDLLLARSLRAHPHTGVVFTYAAARSHVSFSAGNAPAGSQKETIALGNGWTVQAFGEPLPAGILGDSGAVALLVGGTLLSLLAVALVVVLATGRVRALALVEEKTRDLSHLALHDPLTGLPNRVLVLDRADVMLARVARDTELRAGALYVDVDGFKHVNDTHGHGAGDEVLCVVAQRLSAAVRPQDTVGRLGGDEFVVLVESPAGDGRAAELAERLIEALRDPFERTTGGELGVTVSVGVAVGRYSSTDALLRDADLALYAAKAAGKNRRVLYEPAHVHAGSAF
jgi:diguanylate cyclase (GGDEF)-like protein